MTNCNYEDCTKQATASIVGILNKSTKGYYCNEHVIVAEKVLESLGNNLSFYFTIKEL